MTGEYNAAIDKKIAEIKSTCGLQLEGVRWRRGRGK